ncbi:segregation and condensation protein A, partial [Streptomyces sp. NPDC001193]
MPLPADPGRPARRSLGRGPGARAESEPRDAHAAPEGPAGGGPGEDPDRIPAAADALAEPRTAAPADPADPVAAVGAEAGQEAAEGPPGARAAAAGAEGGTGDAGGRFTLRLANFEGPFDLLLQLISRHKLDVTEVALSKVTDEFMAHIRAMGPDWDLDQTTEFLVVAATLLDLKAAR